MVYTRKSNLFYQLGVLSEIESPEYQQIYRHIIIDHHNSVQAIISIIAIALWVVILFGVALGIL